jgi:plasmid stabilization system protein ParE
MTYKVIIQPPAARDIETAYLYLHAESPAAALRWLDGIEVAIQSLSRMPKRCGLARESREFAIEVRQLLYGKRRSAYRILFAIQKKEVRILHVRHSAQQTLKPNDFEW